MKFVIGMIGVMGVIFGIRFLEYLKVVEIEIYFVVFFWVNVIIIYEIDYMLKDVEKLVFYMYFYKDQAVVILSGLFEMDGMIIVLCSMKLFVSICIGMVDNLLIRVVDVILKEWKKFVFLIREMLFS